MMDFEYLLEAALGRGNGSIGTRITTGMIHLAHAIDRAKQWKRTPALMASSPRPCPVFREESFGLWIIDGSVTR